ncbi:hypothetical protein CHELA1G2_14688 [Hyphomicrobiales bacterium]|nr:hypothetical protein CHELA1G2_14688 [Hyphomicrobiales bacterium]
MFIRHVRYVLATAHPLPPFNGRQGTPQSLISKRPLRKFRRFMMVNSDEELIPVLIGGFVPGSYDMSGISRKLPVAPSPVSTLPVYH